MSLISFKNSCDGAYSSLDVRFTKVCDNNCSFCIEKTGIDSFGESNIPQMIDSTLKSGIQDVLILGGEPFIYPTKLLKYVRGIRAFVKTIYITTSLPRSLDLSNKECREILYLIDGLNVSIQHHNYKLNNEILKASSLHNRLRLLEDLNVVFSKKIRTSINLVKGFIDNRDTLLLTLSRLEEIGCKHIKINELQHAHSQYISFEDIMWIKMKSPFSDGCQKKIKIKGIKAKITLKRSCFLVESSRKASVMDLVKIVLRIFRRLPKNTFRVLYENGEIHYNWLKK
jgi:organic radical activating enzyme